MSPRGSKLPPPTLSLHPNRSRSRQVQFWERWLVRRQDPAGRALQATETAVQASGRDEAAASSPVRAPSTNAICLVCRPPVRTVCEVLPELTQGEGEGQWLKEQLTEAAKPEAGG